MFDKLKCMFIVIINDNEAKEGFFTSIHSKKEYAKNKANYHKSIGHDVRGFYHAEYWDVDYIQGDESFRHKVLFPRNQDNKTLDAIAVKAARRLNIIGDFSFSY